MLQGITELSGTMERHPGGHNFPDMEVVIDTALVDIEDGQVYLIEIAGRTPVIKKCKARGGVVHLDPALATIHGQTTVEIFGRKVPCQGIEFSDTIYRRYITVRGKVLGLWADPA